MGKTQVLAGLAATLALAASATPAPPAQPQAAQVQSTDPIGELIQAAKDVVDDAVTAVETQMKATLYHTGVRGVGF